MFVIIGASGFIGTYLVEELVKQGFEVLATGRNLEAKHYYENKNIKFVELDLTQESDFNKLPEHGVEGVVLLAALLPANDLDFSVKKYIDINIQGTVNVLEYCIKTNIPKLISTTSYADVQKNWRKGIPLDEETPRNFYFSGDHAAYVISKSAAADFIHLYTKEYGLKGSVFRLPPVYGVGPHSVIYVDGKVYKSGLQVFIEKAIRGEEIEIFGDATVTRDVVYIKDVVQAFIKALKSDKTVGLYNISSGIELSLEEQVNTIVDVFSSENCMSKIKYNSNKKNNSASYLFDITKARQDFGYIPQFIPFRKMMIDYKKELTLNRYDFLTKRNMF